MVILLFWKYAKCALTYSFLSKTSDAVLGLLSPKQSPWLNELHETPMQTTAQDRERCICDPDFCGQVTAIHTHPELFTTQPGKHKLLLAGSWWGNRLRDQNKNPALKFWHCSIVTYCMCTVVCHQRTQDCFCRVLDISLWAIFDVWGQSGVDRWVIQRKNSPSFLSTQWGKMYFSYCFPNSM